MLSSNTNKLTWVGIAVGVVALLGISTIVLFPSAMDSVKTNVTQTVTKFTGVTEKVTDDYDKSNHEYTFDDTNKTAVIGPIKSGEAEDKGSVIVPSYVTKSGVKYTVVGIDTNAYRDSAELTDVVIPDNVKTIAPQAFYNDTKLTTVTIGENVQKIGTYAFWKTALSSVTIPDNVKTIGNDAFSNNKKLTNVTIGKGVETIGSYAFWRTALSSVTIPDNVKTIGPSAFYEIPNDKDGFVSIGKDTTYNQDGWSSSFGSYQDSIGKWIAYKPTIRN